MVALPATRGALTRTSGLLMLIHVPAAPRIVAMEAAFLNAASARAVDTRCVHTMSLPLFVTNPGG